MGDADRDMVRRILEWGGVHDRELEWMAASCPDIETAKRFARRERLRAWERARAMESS